MDGPESGVGVRKQDPNAVIDAFRGDLASAIEQHRLISAATSHLPAKVRGEIAQSASLNLAIRFERFRHDWHLAAMARDASTLRGSLTAEARQISGAKPDLKGIRDLVRVDLPRHPTIAELELVMQPDGKARALRLSSHPPVRRTTGGSPPSAIYPSRIDP